MMDFNEIVQRIRELDETLKLEMTERARLAERVEKIERFMPYPFGSGIGDTTHDREGEQDAT